MPILNLDEAAQLRAALEILENDKNAKFAPDVLEEITRLSEKYKSDPQNENIIKMVHMDNEGKAVYSGTSGESDLINYPDRFLLKNTGASPDESLNYLKEKYPDVEIALDRNNEIVARKKGSQEDFKYMDDPSWLPSSPMGFIKDVGDIADVIAEGAGAAAIAAPFGAPGIMANMAVGGGSSAAAGGISQSLREALKKAAGISPDRTLGDSVGNIANHALESGLAGAVFGPSGRMLNSEGQFASKEIKDAVVDSIVKGKIKSPSQIANMSDKDLYGLIYHQAQFNTPIEGLSKRALVGLQRRLTSRLSPDAVATLQDRMNTPNIPSFPEQDPITQSGELSSGTSELLNKMRSKVNKDYTKAEFGTKGEFDTKDIYREMGLRASELADRAKKATSSIARDSYLSAKESLDNMMNAMKGKESVPQSVRNEIKSGIESLRPIENEMITLKQVMRRTKDPVKIADYEQRISILNDSLLKGVSELRKKAVASPSYLIGANDMLPIVKNLKNLTEGPSGLRVAGQETGQVTEDYGIRSLLGKVKNKADSMLKSQNPEYASQSKKLADTMKLQDMFSHITNVENDIPKSIVPEEGTKQAYSNLADSAANILGKDSKAVYGKASKALDEIELANFIRQRTAKGSPTSATSSNNALNLLNTVTSVLPSPSEITTTTMGARIGNLAKPMNQPAIKALHQIILDAATQPAPESSESERAAQFKRWNMLNDVQQSK